MINKHSPKKELIKDFFKDEFLINRILIILEKFLKLHIDQQIKMVQLLFKFLIVGLVC